ncbi:MAG: hypothetical protein ACFE8N_08260 [Promethearchaeota archaeon]
MESFEGNLTKSLNRINFMFQNQKITTECINNYEGLKLLGESFGPFEKGKKYKLKLFSAIPFIINNILEIPQEEKCDSVDVQRYAISERDNQKLIQTEDTYFLNKIKVFKQFLLDDISKRNKPQINLDRYNSFSSSIIDNRLLKLLKLAKADLTLDDERRMTNSEKLLYEKFFNFIKEWRNFFLS